MNNNWKIEGEFKVTICNAFLMKKCLSWALNTHGQNTQMGEAVVVVGRQVERMSLGRANCPQMRVYAVGKPGGRSAQ